MIMKKGNFKATAIVAATIVFGAVSIAGAETTLRFSNWVPETTHPSIGFEAWGESIEEASGGDLKIEFYHAGQLGNARDHYNMARDGIADFAWSVPAFEPGRFPVFEVMSIPTMTKNAIKASHAFHDWYSQYSPEEMSEVKLCAITMAPEGTLNFKGMEVRTPDQLKGVKIRPVGAFMTDYVKELGAVPVAIPASEARQAFDRGLVEAIAFPWRTLYPFGMDKVTTHHQDMIFYAVAATVVMNKDSYNSLSDANKKVIDDHCNPEWSQKINQMWYDWEKEGRDMLTEDGHTIYQLTLEERQQWIDASLPLREKWKESISEKLEDPDAALQDLLGKLDEAGAAY